jgi:uncharacterized protein YjbI with pentapeptide repeats
MSLDNFQADCSKCFGLCCTALYFSANDGFPVDKEAGKPCINLQEDFKCKVHKNLKKKGLKGCIAYDCLGAGQKVAQATFEGQDWRKNPETAKQMFDAFIIMKQLYEMLWYLNEALLLQDDNKLKEELRSKIKEMENLTESTKEAIAKLDLVQVRMGVNKLLLQTSEFVRKKAANKKSPLKGKRTFGGGFDFFGADLRKKDLKGENLSGAYLIAANLRDVDLSFTDLIGADLRDADLSGANLSKSIYLTQAQINTAKGDMNTKLPKALVRPASWDNEKKL